MLATEKYIKHTSIQGDIGDIDGIGGIGGIGDIGDIGDIGGIGDIGDIGDIDGWFFHINVTDQICIHGVVVYIALQMKRNVPGGIHQKIYIFFIIVCFKNQGTLLTDSTQGVMHGGGSIGPMDYIKPVVNSQFELFEGPLTKGQFSQLAIGIDTSSFKFWKLHTD